MFDVFKYTQICKVPNTTSTKHICTMHIYIVIFVYDAIGMTVQCCRTIDPNVVCKFIIIIIILDTSDIRKTSNRTWELRCMNTFTILFSDFHSFLFSLFKDLSEIRERTVCGSPNILYNNFIASLFGRLPNEIQRLSS